MVSEEIHLNHALADSGCPRPVRPTSANGSCSWPWQRPSHMVMPAIHMFKEEVAELFGRQTGKEEPAEIEHLVEVARNFLRNSYLEAEIGVTGANIAVAETGWDRSGHQ